MDEDVVEPTPRMLKTDLTTVSSPVDDITSQLHAVISAIRRDVLAADLKWSLFVAACQSYRHDSCLRPFPPMFLLDGNKDFTNLKEAVDSVPSFSMLESQAQTLPKLVVELLRWVLVDLKEPYLSVVEKSEVSEVLALVPCELAALQPSLVVRLGYDPSSTAELRWTTSKQQHSSFHAYHGSKVDNFHSILHHGLQQHLTKNALFGQGVYLSSELLVCLPYSRNGFGWGHSAVATELSVVALCEVLDHPSINCRTEGDCVDKSRTRGQDSIAGEVPHKLYVVPNSDLLRVRYLLVYATNSSPQVPCGLNRNRSGLVLWLSQHKMTASLLAYGAMLVAIGLSRSPLVTHIWRDFCYTLGLRN